MEWAATADAAGGQNDATRRYDVPAAGCIDEPLPELGIAFPPAARNCVADPWTLRRVIAALGGHRVPPPEPAGMPGVPPLHIRESAQLRNIRRAPACATCGMTDPPAERTCNPGGLLLDHYVGTLDGCPGCGRLPAAWRREPCPAMAGAR